MQVVKHQHAANGLHKLSIRKALHILGVTDTEMRFRHGARTILESWTGEERILIDLAKIRWKRLCRIYHEATDTYDEEEWKSVNAAYSKVLRSAMEKVRPKMEELKCATCGTIFVCNISITRNFPKTCGKRECLLRHRSKSRSLWNSKQTPEKRELIRSKARVKSRERYALLSK